MLPKEGKKAKSKGKDKGGHKGKGKGKGKTKKVDPTRSPPYGLQDQAQNHSETERRVLMKNRR